MPVKRLKNVSKLALCTTSTKMVEKAGLPSGATDIRLLYRPEIEKAKLAMFSG